MCDTHFNADLVDVCIPGGTLSMAALDAYLRSLASAYRRGLAEDNKVVNLHGEVIDYDGKDVREYYYLMKAERKPRWRRWFFRQKR